MRAPAQGPLGQARSGLLTLPRVVQLRASPVRVERANSGLVGFRPTEGPPLGQVDEAP